MILGLEKLERIKKDKVRKKLASSTPCPGGAADRFAHSARPGEGYNLKEETTTTTTTTTTGKRGKA